MKSHTPPACERAPAPGSRMTSVHWTMEYRLARSAWQWVGLWGGCCGPRIRKVVQICWDLDGFLGPVALPLLMAVVEDSREGDAHQSQWGYLVAAEKTGAGRCLRKESGSGGHIFLLSSDGILRGLRFIWVCVARRRGVNVSPGLWPLLSFLP